MGRITIGNVRGTLISTSSKNRIFPLTRENDYQYFAYIGNSDILIFDEIRKDLKKEPDWILEMEDHLWLGPYRTITLTREEFEEAIK